MLAHQWYADTGMPLVFLHGLLGSQQDWADVLAHLQKNPQIRPLALDLPYHANSQHITCADFDEARYLLHHTLTTLLGNQPFWLVGYSLGGRLVLDYTLKQQNPNQLGTILEGANIGLKSEQERQMRWQNDQHWANRFRSEPIQQVLTDWYQQPVFADLSDSKRSVLIKNRQHNDGKKIATMLEATSLAKQSDYSNANWQNIHFLIGENDQKFRQMAEQNNLPYQLIAQSGHNAHWENPTGFAQRLLNIINRNKYGFTPLP